MLDNNVIGAGTNLTVVLRRDVIASDRRAHLWPESHHNEPTLFKHNSCSLQLTITYINLQCIRLS